MSNRIQAWAHGTLRMVGVVAALLAAPFIVLSLTGGPAPTVPSAPPVTPYAPPSQPPSQPGASAPASRGQARPADTVASCTMPQPTASSKLILFGAYEGGGMSDFAAAGPDVETSLIHVRVSQSDKPIYAVLTAYESLLWAFEGDLSKVERVVVRKGSAVSGLPASKVTVLPDERCLPYFSEMGGSDQIKALRALREATGRDPDAIGAHYQVRRVELPGATFEPSRFEGWRNETPSGFDPGSYVTAVHYAPDGIFHVDPASTVAGPEGRPYEVLPQGFGISQLVGKGSLRAMSNHDEFRIEKPIPRFPAGLNGAHSVRFVLAKGVPMPQGSPGHSCVLSEETGNSVGQTSILCGR